MAGFSAALLATFVMHAHAQNAPATEKIVLRPGEVFEILGVGDAGEEFSWVLTQNQTFLAAGRDRIFRTRLVQLGTYSLSATAELRARGTQERRLFTLSVEGTPTAAPAEDEGLAGSLATTTPPLQGNRIIVPSGTRVVTISPLASGPETIAIDANTDVDSNGDGDAGNDIDNERTLSFQEKTPLRLWFVRLRDEQHLRIHSDDLRQDLLLYESDIAADATPGTIRAVDQGKGSYTFRFRVDAPVATESLLLSWDFGDGTQSLVTTPFHSYTHSDEFLVRVQARDLETGEIVASAETTVNALVPVVPSSVSSSAAPSGQGGESANEEDGESIIGTLLKLLGIGLVAVAAGIAGVWVIMRFVRRSGTFQKRLDQTSAPTATKAATVIDVPPPPMELRTEEKEKEKEKRQEVEQVPAQESNPEPAPAEPAAAEASAPTPEPEAAPLPSPPPPAPPEQPIDVDATPDWLKQGLAAAPAAPAEETSAAPTPAPPMPVAPPSSREESAPPPAQAEQAPAEPQTTAPAVSDEGSGSASDDLLPPWLRDDADDLTPAAVEPSSPADTPTPQAEPPVQSAPATQPTPEPPVPEPAPAPAPVIPDAVVDSLPPLSQPAPTPSIATTKKNAPVQTPSPAPASPAASSDSEALRLERERERKRRKRQRYRENKRKREVDTKTAAPKIAVNNTAVKPAPLEKKNPAKPNGSNGAPQKPTLRPQSQPPSKPKQDRKPATSKPAVDSSPVPAARSVVPVNSAPLPAVTASAPLPAVTQTPTPAPVPVPVVTESAKAAKPANPSKELPIEPLEGGSDDDVAFMIKAESVELQLPKDQPKPTKDEPPAQKAV